MGKKQLDDTGGILKISPIHLTYTSHDGTIVKEFLTDQSFMITNDDGDNLLAKQGKRLVISHADQVFNSLGKWREQK
jgi:hypothetical protein